jgi:hypothetical protein
MERIPQVKDKSAYFHEHFPLCAKNILLKWKTITINYYLV